MNPELLPIPESNPKPPGTQTTNYPPFKTNILHLKIDGLKIEFPFRARLRRCELLVSGSVYNPLQRIQDGLREVRELISKTARKGLFSLHIHGTNGIFSTFTTQINQM